MGTLRRAAVLAIAIAGALCLIMALFEIVSPFRTHAFYGMSVSGAGRVTRLFPSELPPGSPIVVGDHIVESAGGNAVRGYEIRVPHAGDSVHVVKPGGTIAVTAKPQFYLPQEAIGQGLRELTCAIVILMAMLLYARRPGWMAFAFWVWAVSGLGGGDIDYALDVLPRGLGFWMSTLFNGLIYSGFALVAFALRFPSGRLGARWRWLEIAVWVAFAGSFVSDVAGDIRFYQGYGPTRNLNLQTAALMMLPAAAIFVWKQARAAPLERARIAWATTAFVGSLLMRATAIIVSTYTSNWRIVDVLANLLPLLAIYPILRHRLFDLGFVINRAALYSSLTLAAFGTLAAANWFAQHFVTERLAFVMQPIAAIAIGLGYFRIRAWVQVAIERVLFRERFAAEAHLETVIRGLPFVEREISVDDVLVGEAVGTLKLASGALFHQRDGAYVRTTSTGWPPEETQILASDDLLVRRLLTDGPLILLTETESRASAFPAAPNEPVVALAVIRRGRAAAIVLYGRHVNGTEVEPDELKLLRRLADAAAIAYETADVVAVRQRNLELEERVRQLERI